MIEKEGVNYSEDPETVISGSFRKHMEQISSAVDHFKEAGVKVLAPATGETVDPDEEFIILTTDDPDKPPHRLEMDFMRQIRGADFLYVADIGGYVGQSAATEMAYARLKNLPIITTEEIKTFSSDVPEEAQGILKESITGNLGITEISKAKIEEVKKKIAELEIPDLTEEEKRILQPLIKRLLKDLKSLST